MCNLISTIDLFKPGGESTQQLEAAIFVFTNVWIIYTNAEAKKKTL